MKTKPNNIRTSEQLAPRSAKIVGIVDENLHHRQSLSRGVALYDYQTVVFENTADALNALISPDAVRIDLLVLDISENVTSGIAFIDTLCGYRTDIPIIAIRGLDWDQRLKRLDVLKHVAVLQRPFTAVDLASKIRNML